MSSNYYVFNIAVDSCCIMLCLIGMAIIAVYRNMLGDSSRYICAMLVCECMQVLSNHISLLIKGKAGEKIFVLLHISNSCEFSFGYLLSLSFLLYLFYLIKNSGGCPSRKICIFVYLYFAVAIVLVAVSVFTGWYFFIDENNIYHRGELFWLSQIFGIIPMLLDMALIIYYRRYFLPKEMGALLLYIILPAAAMIMQLFFYGVFFLIMSTTLAIMLMLIMILSVQANIYHEKERKLADLHTKTIFSQIQPHFLYNCLTTIKYLCKVDPETAAEAVEEFSYYLRGNMDALTADKPVPFSRELNHVSNYLSLEQKRFGDKLQVIFDIREQNFSIPPLSVQPIAENSVKYGTMHNDGRITVKISTRADADNFYVIVKDNGPGFEEEYHFKNDGKSHVGIDNVRSRLENICGGSLYIESVIGKGTEVTIKIPRKIPI